MPWAIRTTVVRLMVFFIGTVFILAALIPMEQAGIVKSPFVLVFERIGVPYAADIFNFVILTAILSAANSGLYASGRMLWSLANQRTMPAYFSRVNARGIPMNALTFSMLGGVLALLTSVIAPDTVFVALSAISGFAVVAVWLSICAAHYVFRRRYLRSGQPIRRAEIPCTRLSADAYCRLCAVLIGLYRSGIRPRATRGAVLWPAVCGDLLSSLLPDPAFRAEKPTEHRRRTCRLTTLWPPCWPITAR